MPSRSTSGQAIAFAVAWLAYFAVLQWSVVRFRVPIVVVLVLCTALLVSWQVRGRTDLRLTAPVAVLALVGSAACTLSVPLFSYLHGGALGWAIGLFVAGALVTAVSLTRCRSVLAAGATAALAVLCHLAVASVAIVTDPAPRIDVWVILQQASDALARGENFYAMTWTNSPGIKDAFTYLPWTTVLLAPGRLVAGDVRWALAGWTVVLAAGIWVLAVSGAKGARQVPAAWAASAVICMLVFVPGALTQIDQTWTEPLLAAGIVWWAVLVRRGHPWWAVLPLALACASKQHLALLLPVLLVWRPFGPWRAIATGALTAVLVAPWFLASPTDFVHDTVTLLVGFHPITFADTLYLLALNVYGIALPFWVPGFVVLATLATAMWLVWRRQPALPELLRWLALLLLVANLVNKQAFYNQFWLSGALVVISLAATRTAWTRPASPAG